MYTLRGHTPSVENLKSEFFDAFCARLLSRALAKRVADKGKRTEEEGERRIKKKRSSNCVQQFTHTHVQYMYNTRRREMKVQDKARKEPWHARQPHNRRRRRPTAWQMRAIPYCQLLSLSFSLSFCPPTSGAQSSPHAPRTHKAIAGLFRRAHTRLCWPGFSNGYGYNVYTGETFN